MQGERAAKPNELDPTVWVDLYGDYLFAFALARVRSATTAEDLVQETLLAAMQAKSSFASKSSARTWLSGILKHKIVDHFRKAGRTGELTAEEADLTAYDAMFRDDGWAGHWTAEARPIEWRDNPEKALEHAEFRRILGHCLDELPERIAHCFRLREMDGFDAAEICGMLGISPNNFWVMMHRARLHLRRCIDFKWFRKSGKR